MTNNTSNTSRVTGFDLSAWILMAAFLIGVLVLHLLPALLSGLVVYELVHILVPALRLEKVAGKRAAFVSVGLLTAAVITSVALALFGLIAFLRSDNGDVSHLMEQLAVIIDHSKSSLPLFIQNVLPPDADTLRFTAVEWLRTHAEELKSIGMNTLRALAYIVVGMIIGGVIALRETLFDKQSTMFVHALAQRAEFLGTSFRMMMFAQAKISAINTTFTAIYLLIVLPAIGVNLPLAKTLIAITFIAGLIPVIGNLISNVAIVLVSFGHSIAIAVASLFFLIVVHKAEYFLNARIIGLRIHAAAWELLIAMIIMEAIFGMAGVICAPIYYAYIKQELKNNDLI
ncbi:MAG: AI-2E family transporter [Gammaproteobacteria bacterium]|nr:AI-2E family transporter [Gammaproteobacteria bacterium]